MVQSTIEFVLGNLPAILFVAAFVLAGVTKSPTYSRSAPGMAASLCRYRVRVGGLLPHRIPAYCGFEHRLAGQSIPV
jgi:hypothetical protein